MPAYRLLALFCLLLPAVGGCVSGGGASYPPRPVAPPPADNSAPSSSKSTSATGSRIDSPRVSRPAPEATPSLSSQADQAARSAPLSSEPFRVDEVFNYAATEEPQVSRRLAHYQSREREWSALAGRLGELLAGRKPSESWSTCLAELVSTREKYARARELLRDLEFGDPRRLMSAATALGEARRADISFLSGNCEQVRQTAVQSVAVGFDLSPGDTAGQLEELVLSHAGQGRIPEAVESLDMLRRYYPGHAGDPGFIRRLSLAFMRSGAAGHALGLLADYRNSAPDVQRVDLGRLRADLLMVAGQYEEARAGYEEIAARHAAMADERQWVEEQLRLLRGEVPASPRERQLFAAILEAYLLYEGGVQPPEFVENLRRLESRYPVGILTFRARIMADELAENSRKWLRNQLDQAREQMGRQDYAGAVERLQAIPLESLVADEQAEVSALLDEARILEREEEERRLQQELQELADQWDEAERLLGMRRYDEAMEAFSLLLETRYHDEAARKIGEAADMAAGELRRQAAGLFVRARRDGDLQAAEESWHLLRRIVRDYPRSKLIERVRDNLGQVEEYLERLEPGIVERLGDGET